MCGGGGVDGSGGVYGSAGSGLLRSSEGGLFRSGLFMMKSDIVLGGFFVVVVLVVQMELVVGCVVKLVL